jgi:hypothetical protein
MRRLPARTVVRARSERPSSLDPARARTERARALSSFAAVRLVQPLGIVMLTAICNPACSIAPTIRVTAPSRATPMWRLRNFAAVSFPQTFPRAVGSALCRRFRALRHGLENRCGRFRPPWVRIPPPPLPSRRAASGCVSDRGTDRRGNRLVLVVPRSTGQARVRRGRCRIPFPRGSPGTKWLIHRCRRARAWTSRPSLDLPTWSEVRLRGASANDGRSRVLLGRDAVASVSGAAAGPGRVRWLIGGPGEMIVDDGGPGTGRPAAWG